MRSTLHSLLAWSLVAVAGPWARAADQTAAIADNRPLAITRVAIDRARVSQYEPVEVTVQVAGTYGNPFVPEEFSCEATVSTPSGQTVVVPGFFYVPQRLETDADHERLLPDGAPDFRIRYTPVQPGDYQITVSATDRTGRVVAEPVGFAAQAGPGPGFVRVAPDASHYFALDDGSPFFCVGENLC